MYELDEVARENNPNVGQDVLYIQRKTHEARRSTERFLTTKYLFGPNPTADIQYFLHDAFPP